MLLDIEAAAKRLSISPWTLRAHIRRGNVQVVKIGRLVRITEDEIRRISIEGLPSLKQPPASDTLPPLGVLPSTVYSVAPFKYPSQ